MKGVQQYAVKLYRAGCFRPSVYNMSATKVDAIRPGLKLERKQVTEDAHKHFHLLATREVHRASCAAKRRRHQNMQLCSSIPVELLDTSFQSGSLHAALSEKAARDQLVPEEEYAMKKQNPK